MNIEEIQIVVLDGLPVNMHLREWVEKFPHFGYASHIDDKGYPDLVSVWRNKIADWFLSQTDLKYLLMLDHDMIPTVETLPIIKEDAPLMGCHYISSSGEECHDAEGYVGCGCIRIRRDVLEAVDRPWFQFILKPDGLSAEQCECGYFCIKATEAGFYPVKRGRMGHIMPSGVSPKADGETANIQLLSRWNKKDK